MNTFYSVSEARALADDYTKIWPASATRINARLDGLDAGKVLDNFCNEMVAAIEDYHQSIEQNLPDDECNTR